MNTQASLPICGKRKMKAPDTLRGVSNFRGGFELRRLGQCPFEMNKPDRSVTRGLRRVRSGVTRVIERRRRPLQMLIDRPQADDGNDESGHCGHHSHRSCDFHSQQHVGVATTCRVDEKQSNNEEDRQNDKTDYSAYQADHRCPLHGTHQDSLRLLVADPDWSMKPCPPQKPPPGLFR